MIFTFSPEQPLTDRELEAKYTELVVQVIGKARAAALLERIWGMKRAAAVGLG